VTGCMTVVKQDRRLKNAFLLKWLFLIIKAADNYWLYIIF
jgi:hypothetical protein